MTEESFDSSELAALVRAQHPEDGALADALDRCTRVWWESTRRAYGYFAAPGFAPVQVARCVTLDHPREGTVVVDVLNDGRPSGIEFVRRAM